MNSSTKIQLSLMMFLQFFIWGGWFVTGLSRNNLGATGAETAWRSLHNLGGPLSSPFYWSADRYFNRAHLGVLPIGCRTHVSNG